MTLYQAIFKDPVSETTTGIVVIPCHNEPNVKASVLSLAKEYLASSRIVLEIIVAINSKISDLPFIIEQNNKTELELRQLKPVLLAKGIRLLLINIADMSRKKGGVGLARKIGMDEAAHRLLSIGKSQAPIICFDADCKIQFGGVSEICKAFRNTQNYAAASVYYEHPLEQKDNLQEIISYELHLRLYINFQRLIALPFAFQTVGSSMAVRALAYKKEGGMNTRKAGEDFYFLQKYIAKNACFEINSTTIFPSARASDRVPFGTGRAILEMQGTKAPLLTYNPKSYFKFKDVLDLLPKFYAGTSAKDYKNLDLSVKDFLESIAFIDVLTELRKNTSSYEQFVKRFFQRMDAFMFMKYLHFMRDKAYPSLPVYEACQEFFRITNRPQIDDLKQMLLALREIDKLADYKNKFNPHYAMELCYEV